MVHGYSTPLKKETGTDNNSNKWTRYVLLFCYV
jgi:hypothetical protein